MIGWTLYAIGTLTVFTEGPSELVNRLPAKYVLLGWFVLVIVALCWPICALALIAARMLRLERARG